VFLFRHCVRSTSLKVHLYEKNDEAQNASDFTSSPMPDYGVPENWCTDAGVEIMQSTGKALMNLLAADNTIKSINVNFISDVVQRDVDSSFALAVGMAEAVNNETRVDGLLDLMYDRALFSPLNASLCKSKYSPQHFRNDVTARLQNIAPPKPGIKKALQQLEMLGGIGVAGPLYSPAIANLTLVEDDKNDLRLQGAINVLKLYAQAMFYSRAGGVSPFLPSASIEEVYQLLAWVHWSRSVFSMKNSKAATEGSFMAHAILKSLSYKQSNAEHDATVTIFVGHDGTIDSVGTALGVKWQLRPPYYQSADYSPTPPNSALHFVADDAGRVELSYLYPVFFNGTGTSWKLLKHDNIDHVPSLFDPPIENANVTVANESTIVRGGGDGRSTGLDVLRNRVLLVLSQYPGSLECYNKLAPINEAEGSFFGPSSSFCVVAFSFGAIAAILLVTLWFRRRSRRNQHLSVKETPKEYSVVSENVEVV